MNSFTEENYLKAIYKLTEESIGNVTTNAIAEAMNTKAASVTDMIKKLSEKQLVNYAKYQGVTLTHKGEGIAIQIIRKHRLWEFFLVNKLNFKWDEVHDIAEELEHINSAPLVDRLDEYLGFPKFDPHGDPIPSKNGTLKIPNFFKLSKLETGERGTVSGVSDHSAAFLQYLEKQHLGLGIQLKVSEKNDYDNSMIIITEERTLFLSKEVANNILVAK
ncbi:metal-dependent transcriptional regulator [Solitalea koreensis]|uniref:Transcriptional regulator MntR n=1 Tax=Solitalea koreensis TaxID=543615 RepID=A0A521EE93_9SPHI|nr:metal-dependent transcriptional regulator [Solitalea koreensis]SMO81510.1 iron (metal) dependent repressor, DtxR family [Solitalea koreensis]